MVLRVSGNRFPVLTIVCVWIIIHPDNIQFSVGGNNGYLLHVVDSHSVAPAEWPNTSAQYESTDTDAWATAAVHHKPVVIIN